MGFFDKLFSGEPDMLDDWERWADWQERQLEKLSCSRGIAEVLRQEGLSGEHLRDLLYFVLRNYATTRIAVKVLSNPEHLRTVIPYWRAGSIPTEVAWNLWGRKLPHRGTWFG
ncbi:MAG: hypothetical protein A3J28_07750 [Acidobacteria bacterium RIFCSPLOWO2_12_FULL_60_22]|nr:MAG: hypothetical protein A3J28_07750 [Acidobacteria bacterium RIFCSPLOWO2_12_FULL_60_22]